MNKEKQYEIIQIPIDQLVPFKHHIFKPYDEHRMKTLLASVKESGIIHPIVVRRIKSKDGKETFEIVSGHNRIKAAGLAELTEVPAVVKELTDDEAVILANEANIESRNFSTWLPSEKIKSINQYHAAVKHQGSKKTSKDTTSGGNRQKADDSYARQRTADAYGQSNSTIRTFIELNRLIEPLLDKVDANDFGTTPASALSFISPEGQSLINSVLNEDKKIYKVTVKRSEKLRSYFENEGEEATIKKDVETIKARIREILNPIKDNDPKSDIVKISIPKDKFDELFPDDISTPEEATEYNLKALEFYKAQEEVG